MPSPLRIRRHKYGAIPTVIDGMRFASKAEATRYSELVTLQRAGVISSLECQPRYALAVNGVKIGTYVADFRYTLGGEQIVEDVKGVRTPVYRLKARLMLALHGVTVREV